MKLYPSLFTNGRLNGQAKYYLSNANRKHRSREYIVVDDAYLSDEKKWQLEVAGVKVKKLGAKEDLSKCRKFSADLSDFG